MEDLSRNLDNNAERVKELRKEVNAIFQEINAKTEKMAQSIKEFQNAIKEAEDQYDLNWARKLKTQISQDFLNAAEESSEKARKIFEDNFTKILTGDTKKFQKDLIKELENFRNTTLNRIIKTFFIGGKTGEIGGIIGKYMPDSIKDSSSTIPRLSDFFGKLKYDPFHFPASNKKAIGGSVNTGTPYLVGENGPELFIPDSYGYVIPNHKLQTAPKNINITLNINANDYSSFQHNKQHIVSELTKTLKKHSRKF